MKNLFEVATVDEVRRRMARLRADSARAWGQMTPAQMLAHCTASMDMAMGKTAPQRILIGRLFGRIAKKSLIWKEKPIPRSTGTDPSLSDAKNLIGGELLRPLRRARLGRGGPGAGAWMRFFVAEGAPQNDAGFWGRESCGGASRWMVCCAGGCSKAVAEPPHSKSTRRRGIGSQPVCTPLLVGCAFDFPPGLEWLVLFYAAG